MTIDIYVVVVGKHHYKKTKDSLISIKSRLKKKLNQFKEETGEYPEEDSIFIFNKETKFLVERIDNGTTFYMSEFEPL
jgi:hypothetical protein